MLTVFKVPTLPLIIHPHVHLRQRIEPVRAPRRQPATNLAFDLALAPHTVSQTAMNDDEPHALHLDSSADEPSLYDLFADGTDGTSPIGESDDRWYPSQLGRHTCMLRV